MTLRLAAFWFLYLGALGIFFPYYGLYLKTEIGLAGGQVGLIMAAIPLAGLLTQTVWGQVADRTGSRRAVLTASALGMATAWLLLGQLRSFSALFAGTFLAAAFTTPILPLGIALTLAAVRSDTRRFGHLRAFGTVGFLVTVTLFPRAVPILDSFAAGERELGLAWLFPCTAAFGLAAAAAALALPANPEMGVRAARGDLRRALRHRPIARLLGFVFLAHLCMQGPIYLFPLFVDFRGGDASTLSRLWILMLLLEIPLIGLSGATLRRLGARGLLTMGLVAEGLRWTICAFAEPLALVWAVQLLHGVGVAGVLVGAPLYLERAVPENLRSTGQTLVATLGFSAGAIVSNAAVGWLFERHGPMIPYALAGGGALLLGLFAHHLLPEPRRPEE